MNTKHEKLFDLLADKTLSFGCRVKWIDHKDKNLIFEGEFIDTSSCGRGEYENVFIKCDNNFENIEKCRVCFSLYSTLDHIKIIGHPITKAQVEKYLAKKMFLLEKAKGDIDVYNYLIAIWDYSKPDNLRHQLEVADFLCDLLKIK